MLRDGPTDQPTDIAASRVAFTRLKIFSLKRSPSTNRMFIWHISIKITAQLNSFRRKFVAANDFLDPVSV